MGRFWYNGSYNKIQRDQQIQTVHDWASDRPLAVYSLLILLFLKKITTKPVVIGTIHQVGINGMQNEAEWTVSMVLLQFCVFAMQFRDSLYSFSLGIISEYFSVVTHYSGMDEMSSLVLDIWILSPQLAVPLGGLEVRMSLAEGRMSLCQALLVYNLSPFQVHSLSVFFFLSKIVLSVGLPFPCLPTAQLPNTDGDGLLSLWSHTGKHILLSIRSLSCSLS